MTNEYAFELINATQMPQAAALWLATALARWPLWVVAGSAALLWWRGSRQSQCEGLQLLAAAAVAVLLGLGVAHLWPQPRPHALHLGMQWIQTPDDSGLPDLRVSVLWALALAALGTERLAVASFPLVALGLAVGWCRVYLGADFPLDIAAALPVAGAAALLGRAAARPARRVMAWGRCVYHRVRHALLRRRGRSPPD